MDNNTTKKLHALNSMFGDVSTYMEQHAFYSMFGDVSSYMEHTRKLPTVKESKHAKARKLKAMASIRNRKNKRK